MRNGVNIPPFTDVEVVLELGRLAEDSGWELLAANNGVDTPSDFAAAGAPG